MKSTKETLIELVLFLCAAVSVITTLGIIFVLAFESWEFFNKVSLIEFLGGTEWTPLLDPKSFGVLPLVCGTLLVMFGAGLFALPAGLATAVYLSEYAGERTRTFIKPTLEILSGIPTVVYGFFALSFITPLIRIFLPQTEIFNALSGAIVVGIMILPMVSSLCDDAFRGIERHLREGGFALGATTYEVIIGIVIPAALPRVLAAVVLALSRAVGETMAVTLAAGATPNLTLNPLQSIQTMTAYIVQVSLGDTEAGGIESLTAYAVGSLLFIMTLIMNYFAQRLLFKPQIEV